PLVVLGGVGLLTALRQGDGRKMLVAALFAGQLALGVLFYLFRGFLEVRYLLLPSLLLLFFSLPLLEPLFEALYGKVQRVFGHKKRLALLFFAGLLLLPFVDDSLSHRFRIHVPVLQESAVWLNKEVLRGDEERRWLIYGNARRLAWFLERRDMCILGKINEKTATSYLSPTRSRPALVIILLNREVPRDMELLENLTAKYPSTSKVFVDDDGGKHVVVAVWRQG
ncbi:MAG: hypothetical protein RI601_12730, partial [Desulfurivibrionaceae bacterium]|nr:hypothetical protein [Desulfurivibrionaceae bacterium]